MYHIYNIYYFIDKFDSKEISKLKRNIILIYRNYESQNIEEEIKKIKNFCRNNQRKIFISNNLKIAIKYQLDGLYIPSFNRKLNYRNINFKKDFEIIGSAHNIKEIKIKEKQKCKSIFLSPLFKNQKNKYFLGIVRFNLLALNSSRNIVALGGINQNNFRKLLSTKIKGFASITWIKKNWPIFK